MSERRAMILARDPAESTIRITRITRIRKIFNGADAEALIGLAAKGKL